MDEAKKAELDLLRRDRIDRDKKAKEVAEEREYEREKLERELEASTGGKRGLDFELVDNKYGLFAVRAPDDEGVLLWERATEKQRLDVDWMNGFLRRHIVPESRSTEWAQIGALKTALVWETAAAFVSLLGASIDLGTKK